MELLNALLYQCTRDCPDDLVSRKIGNYNQLFFLSMIVSILFGSLPLPSLLKLKFPQKFDAIWEPTLLMKKCLKAFLISVDVCRKIKPPFNSQIPQTSLLLHPPQSRKSDDRIKIHEKNISIPKKRKPEKIPTTNSHF